MKGEQVAWVGRALRRGLGYAGAALAWLARLIFALGWFAVFALLSVLEVSKRAVAVAALVVLACCYPVWLAWWVEGWRITILVVLALGAWLLVSAGPWWVDYRRKLAFLAEAQPRERLLLVDGDLYGRLRGAGRGGWAGPLAGLLALFVALSAWRTAGMAFQVVVAGAVAAVAGEAFAVFYAVVRDMERRHGVHYFVRGWRIVSPAALEERLAQRGRWPAQAAERRRRWGGWLARRLGGVSAALAQPYGACAEATMP